jgi:hypothetical protein
LRLAGLVADRHAAPCFDELCHVGLRCVIRHATHGHAVPLGQCDVEKRGCFLRVFKKQLIKISKAKEQKRISRNAAPQAPILLHHWGERVAHCSRIKSGGANCEFGICVGNIFVAGVRTFA